MNTIKQWIQLHSPSAQAIASAWALLTLAWATNQQFHDYIKAAFDALPKGVHAFAVGVIIPLCILWRTQRKNIAVAEASEGQGGSAKAEASVGKVVGVLVLTALLASATGCVHQPVGAAQPTIQTVYQKAAVVMDGVATEAQTAQAGLISLHKGGAVPDATYKSIQSVFNQIGTYGKQIDRLLATQASAQTITDKVNSAILGLTSISTAGLDASTAAQVQAYAQSVVVLLQQLLPLFLPAQSAELYFTPEVVFWTQQQSRS